LAYGQARFANPRSLEVLDSEGEVTHLIIAEKVLIASGSRPRHPIHIPDDKELFVDSDQVFKMDKLPEDLIVLGAGVIGCEYATMFAAWGCP
jgi:NAD(P) transhydrogenase